MSSILTEEEIIKKRDKYLKQKEYTYRWRAKNKEKYLTQQTKYYDKYMEDDEYRIANLERVKTQNMIKRRTKRLEDELNGTAKKLGRPRKYER